MLVLQSGGTVSADTNYLYPDDGQADHYVSSSKVGNGIQLEAPVAYLKARFDPQTHFFDFRVQDGCYWANVDGGTSRPASCRSGDVTFWFCPSNSTGDFDPAYKDNGRCYRTDPASWPNGEGVQEHRFCNGSCGGLGWPLSIPTASNNGMKNIFVVVSMNVAGGNGFRIRSLARNSAGSLVSGLDTRIGLGGQLDQPLSLVQLPLVPDGGEVFIVRFRIPCAPARSSFQLKWHDADRPPTGSPEDDNIYWRLVNTTTGHDQYSAEHAFVSGQSEDTYLGGNNVTKGPITISDLGASAGALEMNVAAGNAYEFRWGAVNQNNGIQVMIPFDEADADLGCAALSGVKIDDSGLSPTGSTTPPYGGNCYSSNAPANCTGTLAQYPFSDDQVCVNDFGSDANDCSTTNYFNITSITPGNRTISITPTGTANTNWSLRGFSICAASGTCTTQWLTQTANLRAGSSFTHNFLPGTTYHMRWFYLFTPPPAAVCSPVSQIIEIGQTASLSASGGNGTFAWSAPSGSPTSGSGASFTTTYAATGNYTVTVTSAGVSANCTVRVVTKPYVRIYGGDVVAGAGFSDSSGSCSTNPSAGLSAYSAGSPGFAGAGSQLANFALGTINEFSSAMARTGSPLPPKGLTFANNGSGIPSSTFGGGLGGSYIQCVPDYWSERGGATTATSPFNPASAATGKYFIGANSVINPSADISGRRVTLYVQGDVYIQSSVQYSAVSYANRSAIPNFTVVATGNIYIDNDVSTLSGKYVAQNGYIYTCTFGSNVQPTATQLNTAGSGGCQNKLTVYGSLIARSVKFQRSLGSLRDSTANEPRSDGSISEVIQYGPEVWLGDVPSGSSTTGPPRFDSITSLPPVL